MAPVACQPPTWDVAIPISLTDDEINAAKRRMDDLLEQLDACHNAAKRARNSEEAQELIDRVVNACSTVLDHRASLPPLVASSILSDDQARRLRDDALRAADECNALGYATISHLEQRRKGAATVLDRTLQSHATPVQLSRVASAVAGTMWPAWRGGKRRHGAPNGCGPSAPPLPTY